MTLNSFYYICIVDTKLLFAEWILYLHYEPVESAIFLPVLLFHRHLVFGFYCFLRNTICPLSLKKEKPPASSSKT